MLSDEYDIVMLSDEFSFFQCNWRIVA